MYKKIGLSFRNNLPLDQFASGLEAASKFDFDYIEISPELGPTLIGGRLNAYFLKEIKAIMSGFPFKYTVHCPGIEDMRDMDNIKMQKDVLKQGLNSQRRSVAAFM